MSLADAVECRPVAFLLVDDHEMYRAGMRRLIEMRERWRVVGEASGAEEALRLADELRPQVAIVDLRLKQGDGLDAVRRMHASDPAVRILVSSVSDERLYADKCLDAGASGYVEKGVSIEIFVAAVEKVLSGGIHLSDAMADYLWSWRAGRRQSINLFERFTPRERDVYMRIGAGESIKQIAGALSLSAKTVEYHRQQLKKKLQLGSSAALVRHATAHQLGEMTEAGSGTTER